MVDNPAQSLLAFLNAANGKSSPGAANPLDFPTLANATSNVPLAQVIAWIAAGNSEVEVLAAIRDKFPAEDPTAMAALAAAKIVEAGSAPASFIHGIVILSLIELHRRAAVTGEFDSQLRALKLLHDIAGK
jgi:hypothetical protein